MSGLRKLLLCLAVLACGTALAAFDALTPEYVTLAMWVLAFGIAGNVGEHFAKRGTP